VACHGDQASSSDDPVSASRKVEIGRVRQSMLRCGTLSVFGHEGPGYQVRSGTPARESYKKALPGGCFHRCGKVESIAQIRSVVTPMVDALLFQPRKRGEEQSPGDVGNERQ